MSEFILISNWIKMIFLGKVNLLCLFELKIDFLMSGIYFYLSRKKYDFPRKRQHILPFFYLITPKRRHTSGAVSIRPKNALCTIDGAGGDAEGATTHFGQKRPPFLGSSVGFCGAIGNFPFHTPRRVGAHGRRAARREGGWLAFNAFLALQSGSFQQKLSCRNAIQFTISSI